VEVSIFESLGRPLKNSHCCTQQVTDFDYSWVRYFVATELCLEQGDMLLDYVLVPDVSAVGVLLGAVFLGDHILYSSVC
jgi:hypothetical protein